MCASSRNDIIIFIELSSEYFTTNDLKFLTEALCSVAADWQNLGIQLGVPPSELTDIRTNLSLIVYGSKAYFREMLTAWLRMASPSAGQLSALVAALRSEAVGQRVLSAKLEERGVAYLKQRLIKCKILYAKIDLCIK